MNDPPAIPRKRGPVPGSTVGRKRKSESELSDNPHTMKTRKRNADLELKGPVFAQLNREKRNENQALNRAKKRKLETSAEWQNATPSARKKLESDFKTRFLDERYQRGEGVKFYTEQHASVLDPSEEWEFCPDLEQEDEKMQIQNDQPMFEKEYTNVALISRIAKSLKVRKDVIYGAISVLRLVFSDVLKQSMKQYTPHTLNRDVFCLRNVKNNGKTAFQKKRSGIRILFCWGNFAKRFQEAWERKIYESITRFTNTANSVTYTIWFEYWSKITSNLIQKDFAILPDEAPDQPPHKYFSQAEISVFKAYQYADDDDWQSLPGPAKWWPNDYDYYRYGWDTNDKRRQDGYRLAHQYLTEFTPNTFFLAEFENLDWDQDECCLLK